MQMTVSTAAVQMTDVARDQTPLIQNLGPGNIYIGSDDTLSTANGVKLLAGDVFEFPGDVNAGFGGQVWLVSDAANTDVRYLIVG